MAQRPNRKCSAGHTQHKEDRHPNRVVSFRSNDDLDLVDGGLLINIRRDDEHQHQCRAISRRSHNEWRLFRASAM